jgi:hypothetical protein
LLFTIIATHRAATGQEFTCPMTLRLVRMLSSSAPFGRPTPRGTS